MTAPQPNAFSVGQDLLKPPRYPIASVVVGDGNGEVTLTMAGAAADLAKVFVVGSTLNPGNRIGVTGLNDTLDGSWVMTTAEGDPFTITFTAKSSSVWDGSTPTGYVTLPAHETYIRFPDVGPSGVLDTVLAADDALVFNAEPWDYHTARIAFMLSPVLQTLLDDDVYAMETGGNPVTLTPPRIAVVRSTYGFPTTVKDGALVVDKPYSATSLIGTLPTDAVQLRPLGDPHLGTGDGKSMGMAPTVADQDFVHNYSDHAPDAGIYFDRGSNNVLTNSIYDEHLPSGRWYYYTLFMYLSYEVNSVAFSGQHWVQAATTSVLLPVDFKHRDTLFKLLPPYYQSADLQYLNQDEQGLLQRWMATIGFDLDYTRTLAEGIQDVYDLDRTSWAQLKAMGEQNFAVPVEGGLGVTNYRSLLAVINRLYAGRGNVRTTQQLAQVVSKFPTSATEGINLLLLADDSEFVSGTGSWSYPANTGGDFVVSPIGGFTKSATAVPTFEAVADPNPNVTWQTTKRGAMKVTSTGDAWVLCCGAGTGYSLNRYHDVVEASFVPLLNGIRCEAGIRYIFTFDMARETAGGPVDVTAGILWFKAPLDTAEPAAPVLNSTNYLSQDSAVFSGSDPVISGPSVPTTYYVEARSPDSDPLVYAVPFIAVNDGATPIVRYVSSCMFMRELNTAAASLESIDIWITLGDADEALGSPYALGVD